MSLILLSPTFSFSASMRGEESLAIGLVVAAVFTALWFLIGGRRTLLVTLVAAAVFAMISRRDHQIRLEDEARRALLPAPAGDYKRAPVPDDRGRGRGGDRFRDR